MRTDQESIATGIMRLIAAGMLCNVQCVSDLVFGLSGSPRKVGPWSMRLTQWVAVNPLRVISTNIHLIKISISNTDARLVFDFGVFCLSLIY